MDSLNLNNSEGIAIHAGFPNAGIDANLEPLSLQNLLAPHPVSTYYFRLRGHSWNKYGIFDGDLVIVDRLPDPESHDLVVYWHSQSSGFCIGKLKNLPVGSTFWAVVTHIVHDLRRAV